MHEMNQLVAAAPEPKQQHKMIKERRNSRGHKVVGHSCHACCLLVVPSGEAKAN
jgi:hypothetical protein